MRRYFFFALFLIIFLTVGCAVNEKIKQGESPNYQFTYARRVSKVTFVGVIQASESHEISLKAGSWGIVKWVAEEGTAVASGDKIASIDMTAWEDELENLNTEIRHNREAIAEFEEKTPLTNDALRSELEAKDRQFSLKVEEMKWLNDGATLEDRLRVSTDFDRSKKEIELAKRLFSLQKQVVAKGFDSPFSLREREIDVAAKEIEQVYTGLRLKRMNIGPLEDEIAKANHAIQIASGELWLAENQKFSGATSREIQRKSLDFTLECNSAQWRRQSERLKQREIFAPFSGLVIYPSLWGGQKVAPGQQIWEGLTFMKIVATNSFVLDAAVDETISSLLQVKATATVVLDTFLETPLPAMVLSVGKVPRRKLSRTTSEFKKFPVQVGLEPASLPIRLGLKGDVTVNLAAKTGVFIPRDLLHQDGASESVLFQDKYGRISSLSAIIEAFDSDTVNWLNPPASSGILLY